MPEQLFPAYTAGGGAKQLVARADININERAILIDDAINKTVKRGCLLFAAAPAGPFVLVTHAAMPADTDVVAIVSHDVTLIAAAGDVKASGYFSGEYVAETVFGASEATIDATDQATLTEYLLKRGINLIPLAYGSLSDVPGTTDHPA
jgi:hypothetical protein